MLEPSICDRIESNVRYYSREYTVIFSRGEGPFVIDDQGRAFIDFFGGAGALNYGHNHPLRGIPRGYSLSWVSSRFCDVASHITSGNNLHARSTGAPRRRS
jgi:hypothetical protein